MTSVDYSIYMKIRNVYPEKLTADQRKLLAWMVENDLVGTPSTVERKIREYRSKMALETMEND